MMKLKNRIIRLFMKIMENRGGGQSSRRVGSLIVRLIIKAGGLLSNVSKRMK